MNEGRFFVMGSRGGLFYMSLSFGDFSGVPKNPDVVKNDISIWDRCKMGL